MDDKSIQTEADNMKDGQPLPDPDQIDADSSLDDMHDYCAALGYAICSLNVTTDEEAETIGTAVQQMMNGERAKVPDNISAQRFQEIQDRISGLKDEIKQFRRDIKLRASFDSMLEFYKTGRWKEARDEIYKFISVAIAPIADDLINLTPYIEKEITNQEYGGKSLEELYAEAERDENGDIAKNSLAYKLLQAARAAREKEAPRTAIHRADSVEYPLDKPNSNIWKLLEKDTAGQLAFNLAKKGSNAKLLAYYSIDFDELKDIKITKRLLMFDKLVYIAISALFNAGNNIITLPQIYYAMGYKGTPGTADRNKINDSITKMMGAKIFFDNKEEANKYKKYDRFLYDGPLLPVERGTAIVNGQMMDVVIHIFREPPMVTFAKQRKQITTLDIKLLQAPVSKTDGNLQIQDYLLERISKAKNTDSKTCRILFDTLYKNTGIKAKPKTEAEKSAKRRAPDKIRKYLTHYKSHAFISDFSLDADGLTVFW